MTDQSSTAPMTLPEALAWIAGIFDEPVDRLAASTLRENIAGWDSLGHLVLIAELDERFSIRLTEAELAQLKSVDDILAVLRRHSAVAM